MNKVNYYINYIIYIFLIYLVYLFYINIMYILVLFIHHNIKKYNRTSTYNNELNYWETEEI